MAAARTTVRQQMIACPACGQDIYASVQVDISLGQAVMNSGSLAEVPASAKVLGVRIEHDCTKQATR